MIHQEFGVGHNHMIAVRPVYACSDNFGGITNLRQAVLAGFAGSAIDPRVNCIAFPSFDALCFGARSDNCARWFMAHCKGQMDTTFLDLEFLVIS